MTIMNSQNRTKINYLLQKWPKDTVVVQVWLDRHRVSRQLANAYCKHHWLVRLDNGVYRREGDQVNWTGALYALQSELSLKIHVGGLAALGMAGFGHFVALGEKSDVTLFYDAQQAQKVPSWFTRLFVSDATVSLTRTNLFSQNGALGLVQEDMGNYSLTISSPERAILECLYAVPTGMTLDHAATLLESMRTLRPEMLQQLLECCNSIKVKRLFLYLAETLAMPWFARLNVARVDLGAGKRKIGKGGHYNAKYQLSLPESNIEKHEGFLNDELEV